MSEYILQNLIWQGSGVTKGLYVVPSLVDSGVSTWVDSGASISLYSGATKVTGWFITPPRDIGSSTTVTLRFESGVSAYVVRSTDLAHPERTDLDYPADADLYISKNLNLRSYYKISNSSPLMTLSWTTYTTPVLAKFRYYQRKESFDLESPLISFAYTSIQTYVDSDGGIW